MAVGTGVIILDKDGRVVAELDEYGGQVTIDFEHYLIHEGQSFVACHTQDLPTGEHENVLLRTPNTTKRIHLLMKHDTEGEAHLLFAEGVGVSSSGSGIPVYNRDRNSSTVNTMMVCASASLSSTGDVIWQEHWGSGRTEGGGVRTANEFILRQNTNYLLHITNMASPGNNYVSTRFNWYEVED